MFCHKCGNRVPDDSRFCVKCGEMIKFSDNAEQHKATENSVVRKNNPKSRMPLFISGIIVLIIFASIIFLTGNEAELPTSLPPLTHGESSPQREQIPVQVPTAATSTDSNRIVMGVTQTFNSWGDLFEVTLENAMFVNRMYNPWGELINEPWIYSEPGTIFLRIEYTIKNIGTREATFFQTSGTAIYSNIYEFNSTGGNPAFVNLIALSPAENATAYYIFPESVAQSDNSLAISFINFDDAPDMVFLIRAGK